MPRPLTPSERGRLIAKAREAKGWTQVELAEESGVNRSMLNKIELGKLSGSVESITALCTALDIDMNLLKPADPLDEAPTEPMGGLSGPASSAA